MVETTKRAKQKACNRLKIKIENLIVSKDNNLRKSTLKRDKVRALSKELTYHQSEANKSIISTAVTTALPTGHFGRLLSGADAPDLLRKKRKIEDISQKMNDLMDNATWHDNQAEKYQLEISRIRRQLEKMNC